jgi:hypothetical protein
MDAMTFLQLAYTLKKIEERLGGEAQNTSSLTEGGSLLSTNDSLDQFVCDVDALLRTDERDDETDEMSEIIPVAVKICCKYYAVIRQYWVFQGSWPGTLQVFLRHAELCSCERGRYARD